MMSKSSSAWMVIRTSWMWTSKRSPVPPCSCPSPLRAGAEYREALGLEVGVEGEGHPDTPAPHHQEAYLVHEAHLAPPPLLPPAHCLLMGRSVHPFHLEGQCIAGQPDRGRHPKTTLDQGNGLSQDVVVGHERFLAPQDRCQALSRLGVPRVPPIGPCVDRRGIQEDQRR